MSRIGKKPINLPAGVTVDVTDHNQITVKGPKGTLNQDVHPDFTVKNEEGTLSLQGQPIRNVINHCMGFIALY